MQPEIETKSMPRGPVTNETRTEGPMMTRIHERHRMPRLFFVKIENLKTTMIHLIERFRSGGVLFLTSSYIPSVSWADRVGIAHNTCM